MTGNVYVDALAYAGFAVYALLLFGIPLWMFLSWLRPASGEHVAIGPVKSAAKPAVEGKRRSPFAPNNKQVTK
jgi:hypothetical protein